MITALKTVGYDGAVSIEYEDGMMSITEGLKRPLSSMDNKKAAANSLYIIMLSQLASLAQTFRSTSVPKVNPLLVVLMGSAGVAGAVVGSIINKRI